MGIFVSPTYATETCVVSLKGAATGVSWSEALSPHHSPTVRSNLYLNLGAHLNERGVHFSIRLPDAQRVSVLVQNEAGLAAEYPLAHDRATGVWSLEVPGLGHGTEYLFRIHGMDGVERLKVDPFSVYTIPRKAAVLSFLAPTADWVGVVWDMKRYQWRSVPPKETDRKSFYEVHAATFAKEDPNINIRDLVRKMLPTLKAHRFTHVSFMPLAHHPRRDSWGYLVGSLYSIDYRHGTPDDFKAAIDMLHENGIAVVWDLVHGHGSRDDVTGLAKMDGTDLYFIPGYLGYEFRYDSYLPNFTNPYVRSFYLSNAQHWMDNYQMDSFRVDAVEIFLYFVDEKGAKIPKTGGREYLQALNTLIDGMDRKVLSIGEDTSASGYVTLPIDRGGLGFHLQWGVGHEYHIRSTLAHPRPQRNLFYLLEPNHWGEASVVYPQSHDAVNIKHGKRPFIYLAEEIKNPHNRAALSRSVWGMVYTVFRGAPMVFMGDEFLNEFPDRGWSYDIPIMDEATRYTDPLRRQHALYMQDLAKLYAEHPAFGRQDIESSLNLHNDNTNQVFTQIRRGTVPKDDLLIVGNLGSDSFSNYQMPLVDARSWELFFSSNEARYGGTGAALEGGEAHAVPMYGWAHSTRLHGLAPHSLYWFRPRATPQ